MPVRAWCQVVVLFQAHAIAPGSAEFVGGSRPLLRRASFVDRDEFTEHARWTRPRPAQTIAWYAA